VSALEAEFYEVDAVRVDLGGRLFLAERMPNGTTARILMLPGNLDRLFKAHPEIRGTEAAQLAESLRDAVVMNA